MTTTISAVIDACVLHSASQRDFILRLAFAGLFHPLWSEKIRDEWFSSLLRRRPDLEREKIERTCRKMDFHFPYSLVRGYESIIPNLQLPDEDDKHVLAVAIYMKAKYIVTANLSDFPLPILASYQVVAISPDDFALRVVEYDANKFIDTVARHRAALSRPPQTVDEYLATLEQQKLHKTVAFLREHKDKI